MRHKLGLILGPLLFLLVWALPLESLAPSAHRLAAILVLVICFWIAEPIPLPVTGFLGVALAILAGVAPAVRVLASFGDPIIFLFIGAFMLARSMQVHQVDCRIAYSLLAHPWVGASTYRTLWAFGLVAWLMAMWMSITACVAMLYPVALAVARATDENDKRFTTALLLMLVYAAAAGAMATPVGTPPNLIGIDLIQKHLGVSISFLQWMLFGVPVALVMLVTRFGLLLMLYPPAVRHVPRQPAVMKKLYQDLGPWTGGQRNSLLAFGLSVLLWLLPGLGGLVLGEAHPLARLLNDRLLPGVSALLAASVLFFLPVDWKRRRFTLHWDDALRIDWGTVLLFGSGIALGKLMLETGLAGWVASLVMGIIQDPSPGSLLALALFAAVFVSEIVSNTAAANMIIPVVLTLVPGQADLALVLAVATTLGVSLGFMLPVATPGNAIVYSSGSLRIGDMVKAGVLVDLIGMVLLWGLALWGLSLF